MIFDSHSDRYQFLLSFIMVSLHQNDKLSRYHYRLGVPRRITEARRENNEFHVTEKEFSDHGHAVFIYPGTIEIRA